MAMDVEVNGKSFIIEADPSTPLLWAIREELGLTGTKFGCGIGACGQAVNPDGAAAQIMGRVIMALSTCIDEAITLDEGAVVQSNFYDYPILKLAEAPEVTVNFLSSNASLGGLGEPGVPPTAPALANAIFAATGKRIRQLPFRNQAKA